jgi:hypothetical protein
MLRLPANASRTLLTNTLAIWHHVTMTPHPHPLSGPTQHNMVRSERGGLGRLCAAPDGSARANKMDTATPSRQGARAKARTSPVQQTGSRASAGARPIPGTAARPAQI